MTSSFNLDFTKILRLHEPIALFETKIFDLHSLMISSLMNEIKVIVKVRILKLNKTKYTLIVNIQMF